jgi:hypothetical protein
VNLTPFALSVAGDKPAKSKRTRMEHGTVDATCACRCQQTGEELHPVEEEFSLLPPG